MPVHLMVRIIYVDAATFVVVAIVVATSAGVLHRAVRLPLAYDPKGHFQPFSLLGTALTLQISASLSLFETI